MVSLSDALSESAPVSIHMYHTLFPLNKYFICFTTFCLYGNIFSARSKWPLSLATGLTARIWYSYLHDPAQSPAGNPSPGPSRCKPRPPETEKGNICRLLFKPKNLRDPLTTALLLFSRSVKSNSLWPCGLQPSRLPCPSPSPTVCSNSWSLSQWCHPTILSSAIPFSPHLRSFPASGSFPVSLFFTSGGLSTGASASASVLPMTIQDWFPLGWTGLIS